MANKSARGLSGVLTSSNYRRLCSGCNPKALTDDDKKTDWTCRLAC
jgi:hypothetical protein